MAKNRGSGGRGSSGKGGANFRSPQAASSQRKLYARGRKGSVGQVERRAARKVGLANKAKRGGNLGERAKKGALKKDLDGVIRGGGVKSAEGRIGGRKIGASLGTRGKRAQAASRPNSRSRQLGRQFGRKGR